LLPATPVSGPAICAAAPPRWAGRFQFRSILMPSRDVLSIVAHSFFSLWITPQSLHFV
jgi:hypothetical protein